MALVLKDRVRETTTTTGTGALTLAGATATFDTFASVMSTNDTTYYAIVHSGGADEWEVGLGTYSGTNTLTRTTVLSSPNKVTNPLKTEHRIEDIKRNHLHSGIGI